MKTNFINFELVNSGLGDVILSRYSKAPNSLKGVWGKIFTHFVKAKVGELKKYYDYSTEDINILKKAMKKEAVSVLEMIATPENNDAIRQYIVFNTGTMQQAINRKAGAPVVTQQSQDYVYNFFEYDADLDMVKGYIHFGPNTPPVGTFEVNTDGFIQNVFPANSKVSKSQIKKAVDSLVADSAFLSDLVSYANGASDNVPAAYTQQMVQPQVAQQIAQQIIEVTTEYPDFAIDYIEWNHVGGIIRPDASGADLVFGFKFDHVNNVLTELTVAGTTIVVYANKRIRKDFKDVVTKQMISDLNVTIASEVSALLDNPKAQQMIQQAQQAQQAVSSNVTYKYVSDNTAMEDYVLASDGTKYSVIFEGMYDDGNDYADDDVCDVLVFHADDEEMETPLIRYTVYADDIAGVNMNEFDGIDPEEGWKIINAMTSSGVYLTGFDDIFD